MSSPSHLRVLLIEDNLLDARTLKRHLAHAETTTFETTHVTDLAAGLVALDEGSFDCILLDLSLPDSHGLVSVDLLLDQVSTVPIVVLTGLDDPQIATEAVERGAQDYLTKQRLDAELIDRAIRYAIARRSSETRLQTAQDQLDRLSDRERMARDMHDTVIQQLFATGMALQSISTRITDAEIRSRLLEAVDGIDDGIRQLREAIFGIHKQQQEMTLLEQMTELVAQREEHLGFAPLLRASAEIGNASGGVRHDVLAVLGEALSNVAKHAGASAVEVTVSVSSGHLVLDVTDNGNGPRSAADVDATLTGHGLRNLRERAEHRGGSFNVRPGPGGGTSLTWSAPLNEEPTEEGGRPGSGAPAS